MTEDDRLFLLLFGGGAPVRGGAIAVAVGPLVWGAGNGLVWGAGNALQWGA